MNAPNDCPHTADAIGWALHALEPEEELAVVLHLPTCAACRRAVRDAEAVLGGLGSAVEEVEPPQGLRDRILAAAESAPRLESPAVHPRTSPEPATSAARPDPASERRSSSRPAATGQGPSDGDDSTTPDRSRSRGWSWLRGRPAKVLAASLALTGMLTVGGLVARTVQLEQQRDVAIVQAQSVTEMMSKLDEPGTSHAMLATPDGTPVGAVLVSADERRLVTVGLPANAVDRETYVLWGLRGETPVALGTFDVGAPEPESGALGSPAESGRFSAYAISLEPGRTAPAAPTQEVASGPIST